MFLRPRHKLFTWFSQCERLHGLETLHISVPSLPPGVIITDPQNLEYVFKHDTIFEKGAFFKDRSWDLFGHGIINVDGELHKLQRKAGLQFLSKTNLKVLTSVALPEFVRGTVEDLDGVSERGEVVDLQIVFHEITTQIMGQMAYNMEMHTEDDFTQAFEYASGKTAERFQNPLWFVTELITGAKLRRALRIVHQCGQRIVSKAVADRKEEAAKGAEKKNEVDAVSGSLIQSLLDTVGDEKLVADAALNYLSAGRDTVAQALTWMFYLLMKNPLVLDKLRKDIEGLENPEDPLTLTPTNLPYALAIFYESLRLHPTIPFEIRQAQSATTLPDGTALPASSIVIWCVWAMNRSTHIWGPDADVFRPERWLSSDDDGGGVTFQKRSVSEFPVFNGGASLCLGKQMAEDMAVQVACWLVREFEFRRAWEGERVSKSSLTLPMEDGLPVRVSRRD